MDAKEFAERFGPHLARAHRIDSYEKAVKDNNGEPPEPPIFRETLEKIIYEKVDGR